MESEFVPPHAASREIPHELLRTRGGSAEPTLAEDRDLSVALIAHWRREHPLDRARETMAALDRLAAQRVDWVEGGPQLARLLQAARDDERTTLKRATLVARDACMVELEQLTTTARALLDEDFEHGLRARIGTAIAPAARLPLLPVDRFDLDAFATMRDFRRWVTPGPRPPACWPTEGGGLPSRDALLEMWPDEMPTGLAVCERCTTIFEPKYRHARRCPVHEKAHDAERAPFLLQVPSPDESIPLRGSLDDDPLRSRTIYAACCAACGEYFVALRKDTRVCPRHAHPRRARPGRRRAA